MANMTSYAPPAALVEDLRRLTESELSRPARLGHLGLLLAASTMTAIVSALLLTEPSLPPRASIALGVMTAIGLSWTGFAGWVLTRRRILLGRHRVVAGRLAVAFSGVFCAGALAVGYTSSSRSAFAAAGLGALMLLIAAAILMRARRDVARLSKRRDELERQLGRRDG
jgi:hypothetical protein